MRLVTAQEMKEIDRRTIREFGIPGLILMENAGLQATRVASEMLSKINFPKVLVLSGKGNNGGDGFVVARHLINCQVEVKVYLVGRIKEITGDARTNLDILLKMGKKIEPIISSSGLKKLKKEIKTATLIVDSLLGTGIKGKMKEPFKKIITLVNQSAKKVLAIDVPSGLDCNTGKPLGEAVRADVTVTLGLPKRGFFAQGAKKYLGKLIVADISIPQVLLK